MSYQVSKTTSAMMDALKTLWSTQEKAYEGLCTMFDEKDAANLMKAVSAASDTYENELFKLIRIVISNNLGDLTTDEI